MNVVSSESNEGEEPIGLHEIWSFDFENQVLSILHSSKDYDYEAPSVSPDSKFIAYIRSSPIEVGLGSPFLSEIENKGSTEIFLMDINGAGEKMLTESRWRIKTVSDRTQADWFYYSPELDWSPDGLYIHAIYHGLQNEDEYTSEHIIINTKSGEVKQLFTAGDSSGSFFQWLDSECEYVYFDSDKYFQGAVGSEVMNITKTEFERLIPIRILSCEQSVRTALEEQKHNSSFFYSRKDERIIYDSKNVWMIDQTTCKITLLFSLDDHSQSRYRIVDVDGY